MSADWAWGVEWIWVSGYSAAATTIVLLNLVLFISVVRNRYLHYTFNYVVFSLSFRYFDIGLISLQCSWRNICRVGFTLYLVLLGKLSQSTEEVSSEVGWQVFLISDTSLQSQSFLEELPTSPTTRRFPCCAT